MRIAIAIVPLFALVLNGTAEEIPQHVLQLARIKRHMADELKRLPNYTCLETIDRYSGTKGGRMKPYDRIRIHVALVDGKELYSWPGAKTFDDRTLAEMVQTGFISDGDFAAISRNVFVNATAVITFAGSESIGRGLLRYNFEISQMRSGWHIRLRNSSGIVGVKGWFLADSVTLDLVRFSFAAVDLPPFSPDKTLEETAEYGRVRLGGSDILLPLTVDLESERFTGEARWNHTTFSACRQYATETSISFDDGKDTVAQGISGVETNKEPRALPSGLEISLRLETPVDSAHVAVGDEIRASVMKNVRFGDETVLPRGTLVKGVIRRFEQHVGNLPYYAVGIEFTEAEYSGERTIVFGKMEDLSSFRGLHRNVVGLGVQADPHSPGVGYFYVEGGAFVIPKGVSFTWLTQPVRTR